jgi:CRP-like cAMP-binding protein
MPISDSISDRVPFTNRLIAALPSKDRARLLASCDDVELEFAHTLVEPGGRIRHVYFPTNGSYISMMIPVDGAAGLEVGLVGNEGMLGVSLVLGIDVSPLRALVQGDGRALRMSATAFKRELQASAALQKELNRYLYVLMTQLAQSAACMRFHLIEARLARWLLMTQDRSRTDRFRITHAFLAWMLGVRRAGVTKAARALQARGLLTYKHGNVTVLNRPGLESAACACYQADRTLYRSVLG